MSEPNSPKSPKAYQFMFVLYPESQQAAIDYIKANWPCAWALHDKDTHTEQEYLEYGKKHDGNCPDWNIGDLKKPHYHFVVKFKNARYLTGVAKEIRKYCCYQEMLQPVQGVCVSLASERPRHIPV